MLEDDLDGGPADEAVLIRGRGMGRSALAFARARIGGGAPIRLGDLPVEAPATLRIAAVPALVSFPFMAGIGIRTPFDGRLAASY